MEIVVSSSRAQGRDGAAAGPGAANGPTGERGAAVGQAGVPRMRSRSFCFVEREDQRYTVFLVTYEAGPRYWRGYFSFRPASDAGGEEFRTADLFIESSEQDIDERARGLGRPLILALLESALHVHERRKLATAGAQEALRTIIAKRAAEVAEEAPADADQHTSLDRLRSLYESYRLDQVAHLIALLPPEDFGALVNRLLEGREIDFRASDRLQLAMLVVQELERRLPLPPFEVWVADYLAHRETYRQYAHALHREGVLP
jgi:hypothetical protein